MPLPFYVLDGSDCAVLFAHILVCRQQSFIFPPTLSRDNKEWGESFVRHLGLAFILVMAPAAAQAQSMTVATFLAKAEGLKKKGPLALFSGDIGVLKAEIQNSAKALRGEQVAAQKAGRKPALCMPAKASLNSNELLAHFNSIPPAQRNMTVKAGFAGLIQKKYPC